MGKAQSEEVNELKMNVHELNPEHCLTFSVILHKPEPFCMLFTSKIQQLVLLTMEPYHQPGAFFNGAQPG